MICTRAKTAFSATLWAGIAALPLLVTAHEAQAEECLVDTSDDDAPGAGDTDAGAEDGNVPDTLACGPDAATSAKGATAIGADASATGVSSSAIGRSASASGQGAVALGNSLANGTNALALGNGASAIGSGAIAVGDAEASAGNSTAVGFGARASALNSVALGAGSVADEVNTVAVGGRRLTNLAAGTAGTDAVNLAQLNAALAGVATPHLAVNSTAAGATATGEDAIALGSGATSAGADAVALGTGSSATSASANAVGKGARATAVGASALSANSHAGEINSTAIGNGAAAVALDATAIGTTARAEGGTATAIGRAALASGGRSVAIGGSAQATAAGATAIGADGADAGSLGATASGSQALALGSDAEASGEFSAAIGPSSFASGTNSLALGYFANAAFQNSVALGYLASATRANQMMFGTPSYSYAMPGLPTANSNALQSGDLFYVTIDSEGNLGYVTTPIGGGELPIPAAAPVTAPTIAQISTDPHAGFVPGEPTMAAPQAQVAMLDKSQDVAEPPAQRAFDAGTARTRTSGAIDPGALDLVAHAPALAAVTDAQFSALGNRVAMLEGRVDTLGFRLADLDRSTRGGIAAAMALGGTMIVPDSTFSFSLNASTYQGEQGFSGAVTARAGERIYISAAVTGATTDNSTGGRVGVAFGF